MNVPANIQPLYLLFAGRHGHPAHGARTLVGAFSTPEEARAAFLGLRMQLSNRDGWAELAVVSPRHPTKRLGWFGDDGPRLIPLLPATNEAAASPRRRRAWRRAS